LGEPASELPGGQPAKSAPRIIAVDDAKIVLRSFELLFPPERLETVETVEAALARLDADARIRVVVTDLNMKGGGVPFLRLLREKYPGRVVIVLSGDAGELSPETARRLGIFRTLEKGDASLDVLESTIEAACAKALEAEA